ncbi:MAG: type VI secretion system lipoprotein TssJ [Geminicoccaceae bacterium]
MLLLVAACTSAPEPPPPPPPPPPPTRLEATIEASTDVNPDIRNRPSPVITRLYELTSATKFSNADFFDLYEDEGTTLASIVIRRDEFAVMPLDEVTVERQLQPTTRFIGVVAAYREIDKAAWRAIAPIEPNRTNNLTIRLELTGIAIGPAPEQGERSNDAVGRQPRALTPFSAFSPHDTSGEDDVLE